MANIAKLVSITTLGGGTGPTYDAYYSFDDITYTPAISGSNLYLPNVGSTATIYVPDTTSYIRLTSVTDVCGIVSDDVFVGFTTTTTSTSTTSTSTTAAPTTTTAAPTTTTTSTTSTTSTSTTAAPTTTTTTSTTSTTSTTTAAGFNYVTGSYIIYDFGNPSSYSGTGTTVTNVGGGSGPNGTLVGSPAYTASNGGTILLSRASSQYITWNGIFQPGFSTMAIMKYLDAGSSFPYYDGIPEQVNNNGLIYTTIPGTADNDLLVYIYNGASGNSLTYVGEYTIGAGNQLNWHGYSFATNGSNNHKLYYDTTTKVTSTTSINRTSYTPTNQAAYFGREILNGHYTNAYVMAYLQYPFQLSDAQIAQNMAVFSSRF